MTPMRDIHPVASSAVLCLAIGAAGACTAEQAPGRAEARTPQMTSAVKELRLVPGDPERGRQLFVTKGCVTCHAVNGVGGRAGTALDARGNGPLDPVDFAAWMWKGAPAMIELQSLELGYTIDLSGRDIRHLAAFAGDEDAQAEFSLDDIPAGVQDSFLDEHFWEVEDWSEFLESGQEKYVADPPRN